MIILLCIWWVGIALIVTVTLSSYRKINFMNYLAICILATPLVAAVLALNAPKIMKEPDSKPI